MNQATSRKLTPNQRERRQRILTAARDSVAAHGYHGMIMREVAIAAKVSPTTLYNLYNTKDELLLAALRDAMQDGWARGAQLSQGHGLERLLLQVSLSAQQTRERPAYAKAISQALQRAEPGDQIVDVLYRGVGATVERSLQDMRERNQLRDDVELASLAMAMVGGFWGVYAIWSKDLIATTDLEPQLLRCFLSYLIPVTHPSERAKLQHQLDAIAP